jgi:hypothetical protein
MGVGISIVVGAVGAILRFATNVHSSTWNIRTIGDILIIVAIVGLVLSIAAWAYWDGFGGGGGGGMMRRRRTVVSEPAPPVYGPHGYARTTYDPATRPMPPVADPGGYVVEEEERSLR